VEFTQLLLSELERHPKIRVVDSFEAAAQKVACNSEDGRIISAIMSPPTYLDWESPINEGEKDYTHNKPDRLRACFQHFNMIAKMVSTARTSFSYARCKARSKGFSPATRSSQ
jgi:hypothetical protein